MNEAAAIANQFGEELLFRMSGQPEAAPTWPACKLLWMRENEPEIYAAAHKFLLLEDYLLLRLTGQYFTELSLQTSSYLVDITTRRWWQPMLDYLELGEEQLGRLVEPGALLTKLAPRAAEATGLTTGTCAVSGALDQAVAAVGAGNIRSGIVTETTGGALAVVVTIDRPYFDPHRRLPVLLPRAAKPVLPAAVGPDRRHGAEVVPRRVLCRGERDRRVEHGMEPYDVMTAEAAARSAGLRRTARTAAP